METAEKSNQSNLLLTVALVAVLAIVLVAIFAHGRGHFRHAENAPGQRLVLLERAPAFVRLR